MAQEIADSTLLDTWASSGLIVEPDISKIIEGWQLGEQPPHEYMNWLQNTFGSKLNHILKNGVASWNNETEYLVGSSVQHNANVWLCKAANTNSEPTDANANWKRIITVEALTTVLNGYVATTGDQTIAGVKTFSSSPIVPTPTSGTQAVNKNYVDSTVLVPDASTTVKGIVELATNEETATGTDTARAITPAGLKFALIPTITTGTATFTATTNNINLTGIGIGVEIGDVIQISGANDAKNNSEFTVEVITDNNNIIVNQAHSNKGTSKNIASSAGDTDVTIKLLAKWYNAPIGLGQDVVNTSKVGGTTYQGPPNRSSVVFFDTTLRNTTVVINGVSLTLADVEGWGFGASITIPPSGNYSITGGTVKIQEMR